MAEQSIVDTEIVKGKGSGKGKAIAKEKSFHWTESLTITFLEVLRFLKRKNGYGVAFSWPEICSEFYLKSKMAITPKTAQNKYFAQGRKWSNWGKIRHMETGVGWNETTGCITADEEWWQKKRKELGDAYTSFRRRGVQPEISDLWDDIYSELVASGKHDVAASMEPDSVLVGVDDNVMVQIDVEDDLLEAQMEKDVEDDEHDITQTWGTQPLTGTTGPTFQSQSKGNAHSLPTTKSTQKKRKRQSPSAALFSEQIASVEESGKQMLTLMKNDFEASTTGDDTKYNEAVGVLDKLVDSSLVEGGSGLWCFAMTELEKENRLRTFMKIKTDEFRVKWLAHEYRNSGQV